MSRTTYLLLLIPLALIIFLIFKLKKVGSAEVLLGDLTPSAALSGSRKVRMTYEEALEASKQFIYDIIKAVMQKFSPDDVKTLIGLGKVLATQGMKYLHVVDVQALQYQKFVQSRQQPVSGKSAGRT